MKKNTLTIGILGGMGPAATVDLFKKIVYSTQARKDQEHLRVVIDNNPHIPDRTAALYGKGEDPTPAMLASARGLEESGADFLVIACNTAHIFVEELEKNLNIPVLNIISSTTAYVAKHFPKIKKAGLLATTATIKAGEYHSGLGTHGITLLTLNEHDQEQLIMKAIFGEEGLKAGFTTGITHRILTEAGTKLQAAGAEILIMGCTEIPLAMLQSDFNVPLLDPNTILAEAAIRRARHQPEA
ncbi:MAG: amino acid racemase [Victivallaceae bacterium]